MVTQKQPPSVVIQKRISKNAAKFTGKRDPPAGL